MEGLKKNLSTGKKVLKCFGQYIESHLSLRDI